MRCASCPIPENFSTNGYVGEILIKSDCLFEGYYNRPDLTASAIIDGWYHTGDLGFYLDGELFVVGRKKDLIIVGGENLYPQDIEEIVAGHPAIHDGRVVAMGIYNPDLGTEDIVVVAEVEQEALLANSAAIEHRDPQPGRSRHWRGGSNDFPEAAKMDCEEHCRKSGAFRHPRKVAARASRTQLRAVGKPIRMTPEAQQMIEHIVRLIRKPSM